MELASPRRRNSSMRRKSRNLSGNLHKAKMAPVITRMVWGYLLLPGHHGNTGVSKLSQTHDLFSPVSCLSG